MSMNPAFSAQIVTVSATGLARLAAQRLVEQLTAPELYGDDPVALWHEHVVGRLGDLALALSEQRPGHFADQVGWAKVAFAARSLPADDLRVSLNCLREVLETELPAGVSDLAVEYVDHACASWDDLGRHSESELSAPTPGAQLATRYMMALLEGDRRRACDEVLGAVESGELTVKQAILEVCLPAEKELGRLWHMDQITVAEEHFVSTTTVRLLSQLMGRAEPAEPHGKAVLAAALEADSHDIGLRAVTDLLELDGWRVVFLGSSVPVGDMVWAAAAFECDLVLASATLAVHVRPVANMIARLRNEGDGHVPVLVGGAAFLDEEGTWERIGANGCARTADEALALARELTGLPPSEG